MQVKTFGKVTYSYAGYSEEVRKQVGSQHTAYDMVKGMRKAWITMNSGLVYKTHLPDNSFNWSGVHMIVDDEDGLFEYLPLGHADKISVSEGQNITKGMIVGLEGNHGLVFSGGRKVTVKERQKGSPAGEHNHGSGVRPLILDDEIKEGEHYIRNRDGSPFVYKRKYCRIKYKDNGAKGWIDGVKEYPPKKASDSVELSMLNASADGKVKRVIAYNGLYMLLRGLNM